MLPTEPPFRPQIDQILDLFGPPQRITGLVRNSRLIGVPTVPDSFHIQLHYDALPSVPGRSLPLLATARGSILSLEAPQPRFRVRGTQASFVKTGVDAQEAQLVAGGPEAVSKEGFAVEPKEQSGTLYRLEGGPAACATLPLSLAVALCRASRT